MAAFKPIAAFVVALCLLFGCGGGGGGGGGTGGTPTGTAVAGRVLDDGTGGGAAGIIVRLYDAVGTLVGQSTTDASGSFRVSTTTAATKFSVEPPAGSRTYYRQFKYQGKSYSPLIAFCEAPLPTVAADVTTNLPATVFVTNTGNPPPPPPDGC